MAFSREVRTDSSDTITRETQNLTDIGLYCLSGYSTINHKHLEGGLSESLALLDPTINSDAIARETQNLKKQKVIGQFSEV